MTVLWIEEKTTKVTRQCVREQHQSCLFKYAVFYTEDDVN